MCTSGRPGLHAVVVLSKGKFSSFAQLLRAPPCHVGCVDRTAAVGMCRGLLGRLVGCLVGRILAADVQGKPDPRSPHLQWRYSPVLHPRLRTTCACLGVAAVGCPPRPALSPSGGRTGRFGRWTRSAVCPVQLGGPATRACSPHRGPKPARGVTVPAARGRGRGARLVASDEPHTYSSDGPSPHGQHGHGCCGPSPCECACSPTERASLAPLHAACAGVGEQPTAAGDIDEWTPHPHRGRRVGEAAHPGPPSEGDPELRRQRALHALAQMQLLPPGTRPAALRDHQADTDAAEILSDTLSATTPFASPRGDAPQQLSGAVAPVTPREATPAPARPRPPQMWSPCPGKMPARPPSSLPSEHNAWLHIPLLHAGAGQLDRTCPTRLALASWARPSFLGTRVLAARCAASHAFCACPDLARGRRVRGA